MSMITIRIMKGNTRIRISQTILRYEQARVIVLIVFICLSFSVFADSTGLVSPSILELLSANEISVPETGIDEVVEKAFIERVDPGAKILTRDQAIQMGEEWPALEYTKELPKGMLMLKCFSLNAGASESISSALQSFTNQPLRGVLFDLRGAGGWDSAELKEVVSLFVPGGTPVCRVFSGEGTYRHTVSAEGGSYPLQGVPLVLMVDDETRGTAEIFAGIMKGRAEVLVIGAKTPGDSCFREFLPMGGGRYLFIATGWADWGAGLRVPLVPDVPVEKNINQEVPRPNRDGRRSRESLDLLSQTYADELARRASDYILARARLDKRKNDGSGDSESE